MKTIALGSDRAAKIMAVRASVARVAAIDPAWAHANVVARRVETTVPAMPLTDWQLMQGALERALAVQESLKSRRLEADIYVGLEGGFHSVSINGEWHTFLRGWAYATDGERGAFGAAEEWKPDVVVSDIGLPGADGYEVARRVRQQPGMDRALLVALTGYGTDEDRRQARAAGFDHHLTKPADPDRLEQLLAAWGRGRVDA